jgi:hypothetical protein
MLSSVLILVAASWTPAVADDLQKFDVTAKSLPPHYDGDNFAEVYRRVTAKVPGKSEFETTADYERRREAAGGDFEGVKAFTVVTTPSYDADSGVFTVSPFLLAIPVGSGGNEVTAMQHHHDFAQRKPYLLQNRFGATVEVDSVAFHDFMLMAVSADGKRVGDVAQTAPLVAVPLSRAASTKPLLRLLAIMRVSAALMPRNSRIGPARTHVAPTWDSPREEEQVYETIWGELLQFWVYNFETGEVLGKFDRTGKRLVE